MNTILSKRLSLLLISLLLLFAILASLTACGSETEDGIPVPNNMKAIASEAGDYYLMVPTAWVTDTVRGMTSAYAEDAAHSSVTVCANELTREISSIEAYWEEFSDTFRTTFADFTMLDELPTDITVAKANDGAIEAKKYRYTATVGEIKYQWMQVLFVRNATLYIITYTSTADAYESNLDKVNEIIANFTFR